MKEFYFRFRAEQFKFVRTPNDLVSRIYIIKTELPLDLDFQSALYLLLNNQNLCDHNMKNCIRLGSLIISSHSVSLILSIEYFSSMK